MAMDLMALLRDFLAIAKKSGNTQRSHVIVFLSTSNWVRLTTGCKVLSLVVAQILGILKANHGQQG